MIGWRPPARPGFKQLVVLAAVIVAAWVPTAARQATALPVTSPSCDAAVAHHQDGSHSGSSCTTLTTNPTQQWSVTLGGSVSYPIIADGKVFVTTTSSAGYGGWLYALDAATGQNAWGPVPLSGTYYWGSLAYDVGTLFVNNFDGTISAFDGATGAQRWAQQTSYFAGELVARNGVVYEQGSSSVYALSESTGTPVWTSGYLDGDGSSISVDDDGVYVAAGCSMFRLSLVTGAVVWSDNSGCSGGGGGETYPTATRVFARANFGSGLVLDKTTGQSVGTYSGTPAFANGTVYLATGNAIVAEDALTLAPKFTTTLPAAVTTSPVVVNGVVYVGAGTNLYAVDGTSGQRTWSGSVANAVGGGAQYSSPPADIAVGGRLLVVPNGNTLTALGGPLVTHTALVTSASPAAFGQPVNLTATVDPADGGGTVRFFAANTTIPGCGSVPLVQVGQAYAATCATTSRIVGTTTIHAHYSGDDLYGASDGTVSQAGMRAPTTIVEKGMRISPIEGYSRVAFLAVLTSQVTGAPVAGVPVTFVAGARSCVVKTDAKGFTECVQWYAPGASLPVRGWATFAGSTNYLASQVVAPVV